MKKRLFLLYIILISHFFLNAQNLSNSVYKSLKKSGFSVKTQSLILSGENNFPYNILLEHKADEISGKNLIILFYQEDFQKNSREITESLSQILAQKYDFNITVLFSYGDNQRIEKQGMVYGNRAFISSLNTNEDYTVIILDLNHRKNTVIANSQGYTAPSWLIKNEFNSLLQAQLNANIPKLYISQLFHFDFFYERILSDFFKEDIPALQVCLQDNDESRQKLQKILLTSVDLYSKTQVRNWDHHFLMVKIFGRYINLTESATLKIIILIIFLWLLFIFTFIFINVNQKRFAWQRVKKIIYVAPLSFFIIVASFFIGKTIFGLLPGNPTYAGKIYTLLSIQFICTILLISLLFLFVLLSNQVFEARSVDYLILLSSFINQSLFILVDISLFPIFMLICSLSLLTLLIKKNNLHIIIFVLMILSYIPYAHYMVLYADLSSLYSFLTTNKLVPFTFALILNPLMLVYFRILTFIKAQSKKFSKQLTGVIAANLSIIITVIVISLVRIPQLNKNRAVPVANEFSRTRNDLIQVTYTDKPVFDDIIRTIKISIERPVIQCDVTITSQNGNPILYTDNEYEAISQKAAFFKIPDNPPQEMTFSYGTNHNACLINVTAIFATPEYNKYQIAVQTIPVRESK